MAVGKRIAHLRPGIFATAEDMGELVEAIEMAGYEVKAKVPKTELAFTIYKK